MPNIQSAKKALRQSRARYERNQSQKKILKGAIHTFKKLVTDNKKEDAQKILSIVFKKLDKAAKTNLIKKNKASRLKSRLSKKIAIA